MEALKESHKDEEEYNKSEILRLTNRAEVLRSRLSKIYVDKLDGKISEDFWVEKNNEWTLEHAKILREIEAHSKANVNYMAQGANLVELLENLYTHYIELDDTEKTKILKYIFSNFLIDGRNVSYEYEKPFDIFAKGLSRLLNWRIGDSNS